MTVSAINHSDPCYDQTMLFCRRSLLEECLRDFPDVKIVITSTWRERRSLDALRALFAPDIADRIFNVTPRWSDLLDSLSSMSYLRQVEVMGWLRQHGEPWTQWVAMDDKPWPFKPFVWLHAMARSAWMKASYKGCAASSHRWRTECHPRRVSAH